MTETATWRETGSLFVTLLLGWVSLALLFGEALFFAVIVAITVSVSNGPFRVNLFSGVWVDMVPSDAWKAVVAGIIGLGISAYLNVTLAASQASLSRVLLAPRQAELEHHIERLTRSRLSLVEAFEQERRRIERDLHDGVQQGLVALSMRLGLAELEFEQLRLEGVDVDEVQRTVAAAHDQAEHALHTLRATVRGIHPGVLTDHGLTAALQEIAGRATIPITLNTDSTERLPVAIETCAYFMASEAITNALKHSSATAIQIKTRIDQGSLIVSVTDNGDGGADETLGTGLTGLKERAETLGGKLTIDSPHGGPTALRLQLPVHQALTPIPAR